MEIKLNNLEVLTAIAMYLKATLNRDIPASDIKMDTEEFATVALIQIKPEDYRLASVEVHSGFDLVLTNFIDPRNMIPFIKCLRHIYGLGLKEAKDMADKLQDNQKTAVNQIIGHFDTLDKVNNAIKILQAEGISVGIKAEAASFDY